MGGKTRKTKTEKIQIVFRDLMKRPIPNNNNKYLKYLVS